MRCVQEKTIEEIIEGKELLFDKIKIDKEKYTMRIKSETECLVISFCKGESFNVSDFEMHIDKKGIRFERYVSRPKHDHDDSQSLQTVVDDDSVADRIAGRKKGDLEWRGRCPYQGEGYELFYIPFGSIKVDY